MHINYDKLWWIVTILNHDRFILNSSSCVQQSKPAYSDVDINVYFAFHVILWWVVFQLLFIKYTWYLSRFKWSFQWLFINGDLLSKSLLALYIAAIGPGVGGNLPQHAVCYHKQELYLYRPNCPVHFVCLFVFF